MVTAAKIGQPGPQTRVVKYDDGKWAYFQEGIGVYEIHNTPEDPTLSIAYASATPGTTTALHSLDRDEYQLVTKGRGTVQLGDQETAIGSGDVIVIPRGTEQRVTVRGDEELRLVCVVPGRFTPDIYNEQAPPRLAEQPGVAACIPVFSSKTSEAHRGKVAVITGGAGGLGSELARQLGALGFRIVLTSKETAEADALVDELQREGIDARHEVIDLRKKKQITRFAEGVLAQEGRVDVLVNCAGINTDPSDPAKGPLGWRFEDSMLVNAIAPARVTRALAPALLESNGRVINVGTDHGPGGEDAMFPAYQAAKHALLVQTRQMAAELDRGESGKVTVNAASPGWIQTRMGGPNAPDTVAEGSQAILWLSTTDAPPSGGFFRRRISAPPPEGMVEIEEIVS